MSKKRNSRSNRAAAHRNRQDKPASYAEYQAAKAGGRAKTEPKAVDVVDTPEVIPSAGLITFEFFGPLLFIGVWLISGFGVWFVSRALGVDETAALFVGGIVGFVTSCIVLYSAKHGDGNPFGGMLNGFEFWR